MANLADHLLLGTGKIVHASELCSTPCLPTADPSTPVWGCSLGVLSAKSMVAISLSHRKFK